MPRFHRNNQRNSSRNQNPNQNQNSNAEQPQGQPFPAQDNVNSIPFYNARLFAMYESLIQSYTHFTYHANHMYGVLEQALHGTRNSINSNPYPWLIIPHPNHPTQGRPPNQSQQGQQSQFHPTNAANTNANAANTNAANTNAANTNAANTNTRIPRRNPASTLENNIINALFGIISQPLPEEQRLTQAQLDERVQYVEFRNIVNPINTVCSITHDAFEPTQRVARIRHCGHIFNSDSLTHWLRINNTCPTCRHNLLTAANAPGPTGPTATAPGPGPTATAPGPTATGPTGPGPTAASTRSADERVRRVQIPLESEIDINTFYNELLRNSGNIPGFELNAVDDNSVVFSFDVMSRLNGTSGPTSGPTSGARGPGPIDDVD